MNKNSFMRVNDQELSTDDTLALMYLLDGFEIRESIKAHFGILEFARARKVELTNLDLQQGLDELRYQLGLERATNFQQWCLVKKVPPNALRLFSQITACRNAIKKSFTEDEINASFVEFKKDETLYCLFCLPLPTEQEALSVHSEIIAQNTTFAEAIQDHGDSETRSNGGFIGEIPCIELPEEYAESVLSASIGDLIGPLQDDGEWSLLFLHDIIEPTLKDCEAQLRENMLNDGLKYFTDRVVVLDAE